MRMVISTKWILLLLTLTSSVYAQDPRKRNPNTNLIVYDDALEDVSCSVKTCLKRSAGQDDFGPFWANRGKKDPSYSQSRLYADEPHWIFIRRNTKNIADNEPFFVTRGKKNAINDYYGNDGQYFWQSLATNARLRSKRNYQDQQDETPFFAARGKKRHGKMLEDYERELLQ